MHLWAERTPPTVVSHGVACRLSISGEELFVLVRGSSLLQVFEASSLTWIAEFPIEGKIEHIAVLWDDQAGIDRLLVVLSVAKMVILEWDPENLAFFTVSMHYYEKELEGPFSVPDFDTRIAVDPRCVMFLFQRDLLASLVLPEHVPEGEVLGGAIPSSSGSKVLTGDSIGALANIADLAFLKGYMEPLLAVLQPKERRTGATTGLVLVSSGLPVLSVDLRFSAHRIVPLDLGGCLVYGDGPDLGYVDSAGKLDVIQAPVPLRYAQAAQLPGTPFVIVATDGLLLQLTFHLEAKRVLGFEAAELDIDAGVRSPTFVAASSTSFLVGSKGSDAVFVDYSITHMPKTDFHLAAETLEELYTSSSAPPHTLEVKGTQRILSLGPMESLVAIPSGLAVATGQDTSGAVTLIDTALDLRHHTSVPKPVSKMTGIWCIGGFLMVSTQTESIVFPSPRYNCPRSVAGVAHDQPTLALAVIGDVIVHVQSRSIALYTLAWRLRDSVRLSNIAVYAEIAANRVLVMSEHETLVYNLPSLSRQQLPQDLDGDLAAVGSAMLALSAKSRGWVTVHWFGGLTTNYDVRNLPFSMDPLKDLPDTSDEETPSIQALYVLEMDHTYLGIWMDDLLALYRFVGRRLVKTWTAPCSVRVDPIPVTLSGGKQSLMIRGRQSYLVTKGVQTNIRCIPIRHNSGRIVDVSPTSNGLAYTDESGMLYFADIDPTLDLTSVGLPLRRVPMGLHVTSLCYQGKIDALVLGLDQEIRVLQLPRLKLIDSHQLPETEHLVTLRCLQLGDLTSRDIIVAGTCEYLPPPAPVSEGEDGGTPILPVTPEDSVQTNGWVRLFQISPELKLRTGHAEHLRGTVSAVAESMGRLVVGHGQQVHSYKLTATYELEPVAFYDAQIYVQGLKVVRNLVALGDAMCGTSLLNYMMEPQRLEVVARDTNARSATSESKVLTLEFISSGQRHDLWIAAADHNGCVQLFQFDPELPASKGGTLLLPKVSFFVGSQITALDQWEASGSDLSAVGGTADGSLISIEPLRELSYRALFVVTQQMMDKEQTVACLNPRMHRASFNYGPLPDAGAIIDLSYAQRFWDLPLDRQQLYSRRLGQYGLFEIRHVLRRAGSLQ